MPSIDWQCTRHDGVTLVEVVVTADREEWIRIDSRLEPVWPPRRQGVPVAGWDGTGFEGRVTPDDPLIVGFASPAAPVEPPVQLRTPSADGPKPPDEPDVTARDIVRTLGESAPPRDAVPAAAADADTSQATTIEPDTVPAATIRTDTPQATAAEADTPQAAPQAAERRTVTDPASASNDTEESREPNPAVGDDRHDPAEVDPGTAAAEGEPAAAGTIEWVEAVERRLDEAERLAAATGVDEAREAIDAVGGIGAARRLQSRLEDDRRQLRDLEQRYRELDDRLAAVDVPLSTLERVT